MAEGYNDLTKRIVIAIISIPLIVLIILEGEVLLFFILLLILVSLGLDELFKMVHKIGFKPSFVWGFILALYFIGTVFINFYNLKFFPYDQELVIILMIIFYSFVQLFKEDYSKLLPNLSLSLFGGIYLGYLLSFILKIRLLPGGSHYLLSLLFTIWINDSAAYFIGTKYGKHKIFPQISPKKSMEGSIGGIIFSIFSVLLLKNWLNMEFTQLVPLGLVIAVTAQLGDFFESMIKRCSGVKDSGNLIPGHGGILDRLDSILFAAPVFYYYVIYSQAYI